MRRSLVVLAAVALLAAACGDSADSESTTTPAAEHPAEVQAWLDDIKAQHAGETVVMLMASHPATAAFQEIIEPFEEATGVTVEFEVLEEVAMGEKELLECQSGGSTFDIYMTAVEGVTTFAKTGCEASIQKYVDDAPAFYDVADLMPAYVDLFVVDGESYALPFAGESVFLMYRKDIFEEEGLSVPTTWDELLATAEKLHGRDDVDGVVFRSKKGWEFTYTYSIFLFPFGGKIVDPTSGQPAIDLPGNQAALDYMLALKAFAPVGIEGYSFPEAWQAMQTGKVAMAVEATAAGPELEDPAKSAVAGKVGYAVLPAGPAGSYTGVWGWGLGLNAKSERPDVAAAVMLWLTSRYTHQDYIDNGGIASRASAFQNPDNRADYPFFEAIESALEQAANLTSQGLSVVPKTTSWFEFSDIIGNWGSQAFAGQIDPGEALANMQSEMSAVAG